MYELYDYFEEPIREFAEELSCSESQMKELLKKQYDGYINPMKQQARKNNGYLFGNQI